MSRLAAADDLARAVRPFAVELERLLKREDNETSRRILAALRAYDTACAEEAP